MNFYIFIGSIILLFFLYLSMVVDKEYFDKHQRVNFGIIMFISIMNVLTSFTLPPIVNLTVFYGILIMSNVLSESLLMPHYKGSIKWIKLYKVAIMTFYVTDALIHTPGVFINSILIGVSAIFLLVLAIIEKDKIWMSYGITILYGLGQYLGIQLNITWVIDWLLPIAYFLFMIYAIMANTDFINFTRPAKDLKINYSYLPKEEENLEIIQMDFSNMDLAEVLSL